MAGNCSKKCSTLSSDSSQLRHILSANGVEVFSECTVACYHVINGSVAHLVSDGDGSDYHEAVRNCFASDGVRLDGLMRDNQSRL